MIDFDSRTYVCDERIMASSRIMDLASTIMANTARFDKCLESHNLPSPSFDASKFAKLPPSEELQGAQTAILEAISELQALVLEPTVMLRSMALKVGHIVNNNNKNNNNNFDSSSVLVHRSY